MDKKHIIRYGKNETIILFFDFEFYVPKEDRTKDFIFHANPYKQGHFFIGGTFIRYFPLNDKKIPEVKKYWIWDYSNEKEMLVEIINLFKESWKIILNKEDQCELVVCGIGISRVDIAYLFGRCVVNDVDTKENLFSYLNRLRIVELENVVIPYFKTKNEFLYPINTSQINSKFKIERKREPGVTIWDYYDEGNYQKIVERNNNEVHDQLIVYKTIAKDNFIKCLPIKYSIDSINKILSGIKNKEDKEIIKEYYKLNQEGDRYCLADEIDNEIKYKIMKIIYHSGYFIKGRGKQHITGL